MIPSFLEIEKTFSFKKICVKVTFNNFFLYIFQSTPLKISIGKMLIVVFFKKNCVYQQKLVYFVNLQKLLYLFQIFVVHKKTHVYTVTLHKCLFIVTF